MKVKLNYNSDNDWCIQELDDNGKSLGYDYQPATISKLRFEAKSINIDKTLLDQHGDTSERILVTLNPRSWSQCYIFGSTAPIEFYSLHIHKKSKWVDSKTKKPMGNYIDASSYDEGYFDVSTSIDDIDFDWLLDRIINKQLDNMFVEFRNIPGVYNALMGNSFKILTGRDEDTEITFADGVKFEPPVIGQFEEGINIDTNIKHRIAKYPYQEVESIVDKVLNHRKIYGTLQTIKFSIIFILAFLLIESVKNNYFS